MMLYTYIQKLMCTKNGTHLDYSDSTVLYIDQLAKKVGQEKNRMETFVRFQLTKDNIYFANIEPDFDVLPLISKHFRDRYTDQKWLIYDVRRKYGIYYDLDYVEMVSLNLKDIQHHEYQTLWNDYFKSTKHRVVNTHIDQEQQFQARASSNLRRKLLGSKGQRVSDLPVSVWL